MRTCPKCGAANSEGVNRCSACKAILPIKLGTAADELYERNGLRATHVRVPCPHCGAENNYLSVRCQQCGGLLAAKKQRESPYLKWLYLGVGVVVLLVVILVVVKMA